MDAVAVARFPRHHIEERVLIVVRRYILISRREPTFEFAFEASLFAFAFDTPPFAFALLYPRKTTRPIRKLYQDAKLLIFPPTQAIILKISCKATIFQRKPQHHQVPAKFLKFFDRLTPVIPRSFRFVASLPLCALRVTQPRLSPYTQPRFAPSRFCRGRPDASRHANTHSKHRHSHSQATHRHTQTHCCTRERPHGLMPS